MNEFTVGSEVVGPDAFNEGRWRRIGANDEQIARLRDEHSAKSYEERVASNTAMASKPDSELAVSLEDSAAPDETPAATSTPPELTSPPAPTPTVADDDVDDVDGAD